MVRQSKDEKTAVIDKPSLEPHREYSIWFGLKEDAKRESLDCGLTFTKETEEVKRVKGKMKSLRIPRLGNTANMTGERILAAFKMLKKKAIERVGNRDLVRTLEQSPAAFGRGARRLDEVCYLVSGKDNIRRDKTPDPLSITGLPTFD